jgi:fumarate hydratase subunit beta
MQYSLTEPFSREEISNLRAGDEVYITGHIYTARDAAHKRMAESIKKGEKLPFDIDGQIIYYAGPCPAPPGRIIGSCGPTTSCRMDKYAPLLIENGLLGMIGKGGRSREVNDAVKMHRSVYFAAIGGAGALIARCIKSVQTVAYEDLGTESVKRLYVENMPVYVASDSAGGSIYEKR